MFQLKKGKEGFTVVEGPFKGRAYKPGETYAEIPPQEAGKFTEIKKAAAPIREVAKPAKAGGGKS